MRQKKLTESQQELIYTYLPAELQKDKSIDNSMQLILANIYQLYYLDKNHGKKTVFRKNYDFLNDIGCSQTNEIIRPFVRLTNGGYITRVVGYNGNASEYTLNDTLYNLLPDEVKANVTPNVTSNVTSNVTYQPDNDIIKAMQQEIKELQRQVKELQMQLNCNRFDANVTSNVTPETDTETDIETPRMYNSRTCRTEKGEVSTIGVGEELTLNFSSSKEPEGNTQETESTSTDKTSSNNVISPEEKAYQHFEDLKSELLRWMNQPSRVAPRYEQSTGKIVASSREMEESFTWYGQFLKEQTGERWFEISHLFETACNEKRKGKNIKAA